MVERTDFEKEFEKLPPGTFLDVSVTPEWAPNMLCSIKRPRYFQRQFSVAFTEPPNEAWVAEEFPRTVVGTSDLESREVIKIFKPAYEDSVEIDLPRLTDIFSNAEREIRARHPHELSRTGDIVRDIVRVLSFKELGEGNSANLSPEGIKSTIMRCYEREEPIRFVIPAFPFKDQNPIRTEAAASHVDLGEILMLCRLYLIAFCISEVYRFGAEWVITSDGLAYSSIFNVDSDEVLKYREKVRLYRNLVNLQNLVHITDLSELVKRVDNFNETQKIIEGYLTRAVNSIPQIAERFRVLERGIAVNLNLRKIARDIPLEMLAQVLTRSIIDSELSNSELELRHYIDSAAAEASLRFAAFNLALKYYNLYASFRDALRATIHPKPGQIGVGKNGSRYAWNGVPLVSSISERTFWATTNVLDFWKVLEKAKGRNLTRVYIKGERYPFCYQIREVSS